MPGKKAQCLYCSKVMRSDNLKKHMKLHENKQCKLTHQLNVQSRPDILDSSIQTHSFPDIVKPSSNPKVSAIIDAVINNEEPSTHLSSREPLAIPPAPKKLTSAQKVITTTAKKMNIIPQLAASKSNYSSDEENDSSLEQEDFYNSPTSNMKRPTIIKAPHMDAGEKKLINRFSQLFQEMKQIGRDNSEELYVLLNVMKDRGICNREDCQKAYDTIEDIFNIINYCKSEQLF